MLALNGNRYIQRCTATGLLKRAQASLKPSVFLIQVLTEVDQTKVDENLLELGLKIDW